MNTSSYFGGKLTELQVQLYNEVGASPWSDVATATLVNVDKPVLNIGKQGVTVKEGESETWTVKVTGALAGTVVFDGKIQGEVVVNHAFTLAGSSSTTVAKAGSVEVLVKGEPVKTPAAAQRFRARPGNGQVSLEWADPADSSTTEYQVRQRLAGHGGGWSAWGEMEDSGPQTTSHVVRKLTNGQKYLFQVRAVNEGGEGESSQKGATPLGALTVAVADGRIVEGDNGKKEMGFKVSLSGETMHDVKLHRPRRWRDRAALPRKPGLGTISSPSARPSSSPHTGGSICGGRT